MAENTTLAAISYLAQRLSAAGIEVSKIILFGSQVTGQATADSDVDLIVISSDFQGKDIFDRALLTGDAEVSTIRKFKVPIDIIALTAEELESESSLLADFAKHGRIVFAA